MVGYNDGMKIVAFGASGQVGRLFVAQALRRGHHVVAVSRAPVDLALAADEAARLEARLGDVLDSAFVRDAVPGADVVFSGLGLKRQHDNPYSALISPPDLASRATGHILEAMRLAGVRRLAVISTAGVGETYPKMNLLMRFLVRTSNVGAGYRDLARMEALLAGCDREWMAVRPTRLTHGPLTGKVRVLPGDEFPLTAAISRADVAAYMLAQLEQPRFDAQRPTLTVTG